MNKQRFIIFVLLISLAIVSALSIVRISIASPLVPAVDQVKGTSAPAEQSNNNAPTQLVGFSAANYSVGEAEDTAIITVTLDAASSVIVTVDYATSDDTATAGRDYLTVSGVLTFTSGITSQTFAVSILDDALDESDETITLTLSHPTHGTLSGTLRIPAFATLTILDNDYNIYLPLVSKRWPPIPDVPVLNAISNPDGDGNYNVAWNAAYLANTYTLQEDDNSTFSSPETRCTGPSTSCNVSGKPTGTYYYRVKASNSWGDSDWSNVQSVQVGPPDTPVLNPINNSDGDENYTVSWNPAHLAQIYTLQEDDNPTFSSPVRRYLGPDTSWSASDQARGTYYYRVKATNSMGDSGWSNVQPVTVQTGWVIILSDGFEGAFPGGTWTVRDNDSDSGRYYWGRRDCKPHSGSYSVWNVGAGDSTVSCGSYYRNDMYAWMIYGPFSLANATAAELTFDWWSDTETCCDAFAWGASINGNDYYGVIVAGNWSSWTTGERLDLSDIPTLGNLLGRNRVWIAFIFGSDYSITDRGSFVDNVLLRKRTSGMVSASQNPPSVQRVLQPGQTMGFGEWRLDQPGVWNLSQETHCPSSFCIKTPTEDTPWSSSPMDLRK